MPVIEIFVPIAVHIRPLMARRCIFRTLHTNKQESISFRAPWSVFPCTGPSLSAFRAPWSQFPCTGCSPLAFRAPRSQFPCTGSWRQSLGGLSGTKLPIIPHYFNPLLIVDWAVLVFPLRAEPSRAYNHKLFCNLAN